MNNTRTAKLKKRPSHQTRKSKRKAPEKKKGLIDMKVEFPFESSI